MSMDHVQEYIYSIFIGATVAYLVFFFLTEYGAAAKEARSQAVAADDSSLAELYINISPSTFFFLRIILTAIAFFAVAPIAGLFGGLAVGAGAFFLPALQLSRMRAKRTRKVETQLVDALELLGNSLKSGLTIQQAVELVVKEFPPPIRQEFALVLSETRLGVEFTDALKNMGERLRSNIVQVLATGVTVTKRCGGDLTVIFNNIAATIRELATIEGKLNAVTAQGRFQGLILGMMPFALIILLYFVDRSHVETLFGYSLGRWAVGAVVMMVIMAQLWIRKLLAIDV